MIRLVDLKCLKCGKLHEVLTRGDEKPAVEEPCECGNAEAAKFEVVPSFARSPTHTSWAVR